MRLFEKNHPAEKPPRFLYDVTSSHLEGRHNALGAFGYNRDGKGGKKQIVSGLPCDGGGMPLAIEVFAGNTLDPKTVASQIHKVATRFGRRCHFRRRPRHDQSPQIAEPNQQDFHYITAITKPKIESLFKTKVLQMELIDQALAEVCEPDLRYVLRRHPVRAGVIEANRQSMLDSLSRRLAQANLNLTEHPRAKVATALKSLQAQIAKLKLSSWVSAGQAGDRREVQLQTDEEERAEESKLDGCYVLKPGLTTEQADKETVHSRYKDLALVEQAFRIFKTVELEQEVPGCAKCCSGVRKVLADGRCRVLNGGMKSLFAVVAFGALCGSVLADDEAAKEKLVTVEQAEQKLADGIPLLDARTREEWDEGRLKGAVLVPVTEDGFVEKAKAALDPAKPVLVYCRSGGRSVKAVKELRDAGFTRVYELKGGILAWEAAGKPVEK